MPRKPIDFFGEDSPLFTKPPSKKKAAKKKIAIKKRQRKKVDLGDLFAKTSEPEPKKRGPKSHADLAEEEIVKENKRVAKRRASRTKKRSTKPKKVQPKVTSPADCKHILPAFKKFLVARWKLLTGTDAQAATVSGYISGAMSVCSNNEKRLKEHEELYVLRAIAKRIYNERS